MDVPISLPFSKAFDFASENVAERFQNPLWKIKEMLFVSRNCEAVAEVKRFGGALVSSAVEKRRKSASDDRSANSSDSLQSNLIDLLLDHIEDHQVVADAAMNYLSAGLLFRQKISN